MLTISKKLNKPKNQHFLGSETKVRSQGKLLPPTLKRQRLWKMTTYRIRSLKAQSSLGNSAVAGDGGIDELLETGSEQF